MSTVLFVAETDSTIGLGHAVRSACLFAAERESWPSAMFFVSEPNPVVEEFAKHYGVELSVLSQEGWSPDRADSVDAVLAMEPDLVVVDSPNITAAWAAGVRQSKALLIYFGGTGIAPVEADGCIWPDICPESKPPTDAFACGIEFVPLAPEYAAMSPVPHEGTVHNVLVTTGGVDHYDLCSAAVRALDRAVDEPLSVKVAIGAHFDNAESVRRHAQASRHQVELIESPRGLWDLIEWADLALCGGGGTLCELARLGVPAIGTAIWPIQAPLVQHFHDEGAILGLIYRDSARFDQDLEGALRDLTGSPSRLTQMSAAGPQIVDGKGTRRIAEWIKAVAAAKGRSL